MINRNFTSNVLFEIKGWDVTSMRYFVQHHAPEITIEDLLKLSAQLSLDYYIHPNGSAFDNLQDSLEDLFGYNELNQDSPDYLYENIERDVQVYMTIISDFARNLDSEIESAVNRTRIPLDKIQISRAFVRGHTFSVQFIDYDREVW
ncbi:hypothetical protein TOTORO_00200 [Serratia phage vB_SmaS-Totoro]|nr:hypothetical protein TOTORO_00200 [Serratia phage vB_SmaS-Totoro]